MLHVDSLRVELRKIAANLSENTYGFPLSVIKADADFLARLVL